MTDDMFDGLYIHRRNDLRPNGTRTCTICDEGGMQEWVHADDFMEVQKHRDDLRREMALINAMIMTAIPDREAREYTARACSCVGFTQADGEAMLSIIRKFEPESTRGDV